MTACFSGGRENDDALSCRAASGTGAAGCAGSRRGAAPCFAFSRGDFGFTAYELSGSGRYLLRVDLCGSASALIAFSQYLYDHPERSRAALVVIGGCPLTEETVNGFIELLPDFPLLLPGGVPDKLRDYAVSRAALKGVTLFVAETGAIPPGERKTEKNRKTG